MAIKQSTAQSTPVAYYRLGHNGKKRKTRVVCHRHKVQTYPAV